MVIRILGLIAGLLLVATPFIPGSTLLHAARNNPGILLGPVMGIVFVAYALGGKRLSSRLAPWLDKSARQSMQAARIEPDLQQRLEGVTPKVYVTSTLIAVNALIFVAMVADGAGLLAPNWQVYVRWGSNFGPLTTDGQWWRLVTSTFLHFGVLHLAFNMWALYESGRLVERLYGNLYFLVVYLFAGVFGGLCSLLWHPIANGAGASGAIFGVLGGLLAFILRMRDSMPFSVTKALRNSTLVFIAYSLMSGFTTPGIDNAAHLGGLAGGFLAGLVFARPLDVERRTKGVGSKLAVSLAMSVLGLLLLLSFAIRIDSNDAQVHSIRAAYLVTQGNLDRAIIESDQAIRLNPNDALPHIFRAVYLVKQGNLDRAIIELDQAIRLNSNNARAYWLRGLAKEQNGDIEGAIADLALAIQDNPARDDGGHGESSLLPPSKSAEAHNHVAWLLATAAQPGIRDGRRALESALKACELTQWKNAAFIDTLAAAYARSGDFAKAAEWQQKAATDPRLGRDDSALQRLRLYQAGKAYPPD